jgi:outer membrane protein insertion porin family
VRFGHIVEIAGNPIIPANKLFFLGGADTLRGFDEDAVNPSGGTVLMLYNAELQVRLTNSFKLAGFFDAGTLVDDIDTLDWSNFRESAGAGLRYVTPIGPLRLDWAFILDRQAGEPTNHIHFSFGYYF